MRQRIDTRRAGWQAIVSGVVGLALVLQLVYVPLHLVRHEHSGPATLAGALADNALGRHSHQAGHRHGDHGHVHVHASDERSSDQPRPDDSESGHAPHSAADHLDQSHEGWCPSGVFQQAIVLCASAIAVTGSDASVWWPVVEVWRGPRPPPDRSSSAPRAPPSAA